ncbi:hypothetical protein KP79_PYT24928 [Mizuhopecten yessoensis]|uniref:Uncharacterized protein n=1 Tax=Mizuhopecten yessoensis TaxID=6573 RepID=A0A210R3W3_MIZYE|nr:hypothetical protein KP79_PYT24928 [Mizuhopecten yessoensis]
MIFWGLDEDDEFETWEKCEKKVRDCMVETLGLEDAGDDREIEIERAHRLGRKKVGPNSKARGIIVKFGRWKHKQRVKNAVKEKLSKDSGYKGKTRVSEDYSQELRNIRKELLDAIPSIKTENPGKKVFLNYDKVTAGRNIYKYDTCVSEVYLVTDRRQNDGNSSFGG